MGDGFIIQCPDCQAKMRLRNEASLKRETTCPKCSCQFLPEDHLAPAAPEAAAPKSADTARQREEQSQQSAAPKRSAARRPKPSRRQPAKEAAPRATRRRRPAAVEEPAFDDFEDFDEVDDVESFDDDLEDFDDFEAAPRSRRTSGGRSSKTRSKKSKKRRSSGSPAWQKYGLIGGIVVLGLAVVAGIGYGLMQLTGLGGNAIDLTYLPEDVELVVYAEVADIWEAEILKEFTQDNAALRQPFTQMLGPLEDDITPSNIESVTIGATGLSRNGASPFGGGFSSPNTEAVLVVRFGRAPDTALLDDASPTAPFEEVEHEGTKYLRSRSGFNQTALYRPSGTTWVVGEEDIVKKVIAQGSKEPRRKDMDFVDTSHDLLIIVAPQNIKSTGEITAASGEQRFQQVMNANIARAYFGASFGSDIKLAVGTDCYGAPEAESTESELNSGFEKVKQQLDQARGMAPEQAAELLSVADQIVSSVSVSRSGTTVTMAGTIPGSIKSAFETASGGTGAGGMAQRQLQSMLSGALSGMGGLGNRARPSPLTDPLPSGTSRPPGTPPSTSPGSARIKNNLRQIGMAMHQYHTINQKFPDAAISSDDGRQLLSWRVELLPQLGRKDLYDKFDRTLPWDAPHNIKLLAEMPPVFESGETGFQTTICLAQGEGTVFENGRGCRMADIHDGSSNTAMAVQTAKHAAVPWTRPDTYSFRKQSPMFHLPVGGTVLILLADGSAREFNADPTNLAAIFTRAGHEVVRR